MMIGSVVVLQLLLIGAATRSESSCSSGCDLALASYYFTPNLNLTYISRLFGRTIEEVLPFNKDSIINKDSILAGSRVKINFPCDCVNDDFLGCTFPYTTLSSDTYDKIATTTFANLTTAAWLATVNTYPPTRIPDGVTINVTVNCSCGDSNVSPDYGLFLTYPLRPEDNLSSLTAALGLPSSDQALLQSYNPGVSFNASKGIVFLPTKDSIGSYHPLPSSSGGIASGAIAGISVAGAVLLVAAICLYLWIYKRKKQKMALLNLSLFEDNSIQHDHGTTTASDKTPVLTPRAGGASPFTGITVDKSVEFSYEELSKATNDFSLANKIGQGGFGAVYYAELRGEKAAIKKMDMQGSREFIAELKVLTRVHHLNLVRLIGYCTEVSLFLVYEYIENGNLSEHLRGSGRDPLLWSDRVQIALDSARGLEYIHEHTVPVYIHRDIKSSNILIDKNFHAKVADFGLTKLIKVGSTSLRTRVAGTFGYMPPEYAYGNVSPKADVYAFGVVLYELISAKAALFKSNETDTESKVLVALFEEALNQPDPKEDLLRKLVDPRLGDNQLVDSIHKMAQLAKACTQVTPKLRPSMRSIVVTLMTLSSTTEDWDMGPFYENQVVKLMPGSENHEG